MAEEHESLVMRRSRRSNAGNRMEAVMAEFEAGGTAKDADLDADLEEDVDFVVVNDEQDAFEADFESTDDEAMKEDDEASEKAVLEQEQRAQKANRTRAARATETAHARQRATFNPQASTSSSAHKYGAPLEDPKLPPSRPRSASKRQSRRKHTMENTSATVERMRDAERKAPLQRRKTEIRMPTQDELIANALDMEEVNIVEHRDYLILEEEKRRMARTTRKAMDGPVLRWISRSEISPLPADLIQSPASAVLPEHDADNPKPYPTPNHGATTSLSHHEPPSPTFPQPKEPDDDRWLNTLTPHVDTETVERNYVVHELEQTDQARQPSWEETMQAMFGDHVRWDEVKAFVGNDRPKARIVQQCPLTGLPAKYLDPRTNVPFANVHAFQTLSSVLEHRFIWSATHGCYVTKQGQPAEAMDSE